MLEYTGVNFAVVNYGAITTPAGMDFTRRLKIIYDDTCEYMDRFSPDVVSIEKLFFNTNQKTGIDVSQARGVIILAATQRCIPVFEYTPLQVKQAVVGYGRAEKHQVMDMTKRILGLKSVPKPDDTADALAMAICHGHCSHSAAMRKENFK